MVDLVSVGRIVMATADLAGRIDSIEDTVEPSVK
jgi:hypothetical protein